jgi:lipopolysaccharide export system protein LptA
MGEITFMRAPRLACPDGMRVSADSLFFYESRQEHQLFGNVSFENADISLRARNAQYYSREGRITAQRNVRLLRKEDRSSITGENLELLQKNAQRPEDQLTVTGGRPHLVMHPKPREGAPPDSAQPFEVDADRIFLQGEQMQARGRVELRRGELRGSGNEVDYYGATGQLMLRTQASLLTADNDLSGGSLQIQMPDGQVEEVFAREGAKLVRVNQKLRFEAPMINFVLANGELERLTGARDPAWVPTDSTARVRPIAIAENFTISGDSLEVSAPGGVLQSVLAIGRAHATSTAGDLTMSEMTPEIAREDWIQGDSILAEFAPVEPDSAEQAPEAAADTANGESEFRLEQLRAYSNARAFYRMPVGDSARSAEPDSLAAAVSADSAAVAAPSPDSAAAHAPASKDCIAFHHVTGNAITIFMQEGTVTSMQVVGQVAGQHWDPPCATRTAPPPAITPPTGAPASAPPPAGSPPPPPPRETSGSRRPGPARSSVLGP